MKLKLTKPIVFFDVESTGLNPATDRIVEISMLKVHPDGKEEVLTQRINPEIPIPEESSKIHGIYDRDVAAQPAFKEAARTLMNFIKSCDLGGYNSNRYDIPLLAEEFERAGIELDLKKMKFIDVQVIFFKQEPRTLSGAYKFYCNKDLEGAHSAEADVKATWEILKAQVERYDDLGDTNEALARYSSSNNFADLAGRLVYDDEGQVLFNFGKHKGRKVAEIFEREPAYYSWMMQGDFPAYTKRIITRIYMEMRSK